MILSVLRGLHDTLVGVGIDNHRDTATTAGDVNRLAGPARLLDGSGEPITRIADR